MQRFFLYFPHFVKKFKIIVNFRKKLLLRFLFKRNVFLFMQRNRNQYIIQQIMKIKESDQVCDDSSLNNKHLFTQLEELQSRVDFAPQKRVHFMNEKNTLFDVSSTLKNVQQNNQTFIIQRSHKRERNTRKVDGKANTNFTFQLKQIMHSQKVDAIVKNFQEKVRRNNPASTPVQFEPYDLTKDNSFLSQSGIHLSKNLTVIFAMLQIFQALILFFTYSLILVFPFLREEQIVLDISIFSMVFYIFEVVMNLFVVREKEGKKITKVQDIMKDYLYGNFSIDILCFLVLTLDISVSFQFMRYLRLIILLKLRIWFEKLQIVENSLINSFYKEQYWGLAKVFLLNFFFAHILSICLLGMTGLTAKNWLTKVNALHAPWYEKYAWAYYWGTTTMLTVGYGDLAATNYIQAICLTFIQTFSCIALAYNINCVGTLISNIRSQDIEKQRKCKIMHQLSNRNELPEELNWKINNYIEQTCKMKKIFNIEEEKKFISSLPPGLKTNFLKQSNKKIFQNISFFTNFTEKTLINLASELEMFVAYPEEIIYSSQKANTLMILRDGKVGYCTKVTGSDFNETIINQIRARQKGSPYLLSLDYFLHRPINYEIKSLRYSIIYQFQAQLLKEISKTSKLDFQNLCMIIDRSHHRLDQYELVKCDLCTTKHTKMRCPRIHYMPIKQHVINRELRAIKIAKNKRVAFERPQKYEAHYICSMNGELEKNSLIDRIKEQQCFPENPQISLERLDAVKGTITQLASIDKIPASEGFLEKKVNQISDNVKSLINREQLIKETQSNFWNIECDQIFDFKFYFTNDNAKNLKDKHPGH